MANFYQENDDLRFYVEKWIDWAPLVELTEYMGLAKDGFETTSEAVEFYGDILDLIGQFVADEVAPHTEEIDREGVALIDGEAVLSKRQNRIFEQLKALELHGMCLPRCLPGIAVLREIGPRPLAVRARLPAAALPPRRRARA